MISRGVRQPTTSGISASQYARQRVTLLSSQIYAEGFGQGAYSRFDVRFYQTLNDVVSSNALPLVLPRYEYSYFGEPDALGGRLSIDAGTFNVVRGIGTNTRRVSFTTNWDRPFVGALGDLWTVKLHNDAAAYDASAFNEQPNFGPVNQIGSARALPQAALNFRWPFMRNSGALGHPADRADGGDHRRAASRRQPGQQVSQ